MFETLFKSEALLGVLIGATFSFLGLLINTSIEAWKESRRERFQRLSEIRTQMGLTKGIQGKDVTAYINAQLPFWLRFLRQIGVFVPHSDLSHADLRRVSLKDYNLNGVNFSFADLTGADLHNARLRKANFRGAILINADLLYRRSKEIIDGNPVYTDRIVWQDCILYNTSIHSDEKTEGAITNIKELENKLKITISNFEEFESSLKTLGVDITSAPVEQMYQAFQMNNFSN